MNEEMGMLVVLTLLWKYGWLIWGLIGLAIGSRKRINPVWAFLGGVILGPLSPLMIFISKVKKSCPACGEDIPVKAVVCKHCQHKMGDIPKAA